MIKRRYKLYICHRKIKDYKVVKKIIKIFLTGVFFLFSHKD